MISCACLTWTTTRRSRGSHPISGRHARLIHAGHVVLLHDLLDSRQARSAPAHKSVDTHWTGLGVGNRRDGGGPLITSVGAFNQSRPPTKQLDVAIVLLWCRLGRGGLGHTAGTSCTKPDEPFLILQQSPRRGRAKQGSVACDGDVDLPHGKIGQYILGMIEDEGAEADGGGKEVVLGRVS